MEPKSLIAAIVLICLIVWSFIADSWRSPIGALSITSAVLIVVKLLGLWMW